MKYFYILLCLSLLINGACNQGSKTASQEEKSLSAMPYQEVHRPQFHFSPQEKWMNDPNGMFFYQGEYHLFYQYYPDSTVWGPMHWGHAISQDLVHWEHLPIALYPDSLGWIFSGSAVVDYQNTSGFGTTDNPPLVAIYTYHNEKLEKQKRNDFQYQAIAYSTDKGRTWTKYAKNPVLKNPGIRDFRDPKVFWHQTTKKWVMILAAQDQVKLYGSKNLKDWEFLSDFGKEYGAHGGVWECPDLFPLPHPTEKDKEKWLMLVSINPGGPNKGSATQYFVGDFDGKNFKIDDAQKNETLWLDYGTDNYAGVTFFGAPNRWVKSKSNEEVRILIGWMSNWLYATTVPTEKWRSAMTFPRVFDLKNTAQGLRLVSNPILDLNSLRNKTAELKPQTWQGNLPISDSKSSLYEIYLEIEKNNSKEIALEISNSKGEKLLIGYESVGNRFFIDRTKAGKKDFFPEFAARHYAPRFSEDKIIKFQVLLDVASVELFADEGLTVMTDIFFPNENFSKIALISDQNTQLLKGKITPLKSIW
jgi:fructan beta-fructosidase